jgi:acetyl esterase/lipase
MPVPDPIDRALDETHRHPLAAARTVARALSCGAAVVLLASAASGSDRFLTIRYRRVGGLAIEADVFRPAGLGPFPVLLWIHGGALIFGDRGMLPADQRGRYLRAGLAVASIDYRLAPETKRTGSSRTPGPRARAAG